MKSKLNIWFFSPYEQPYGQTSRNFNFARLLAARGHCTTLIVNSICHRTHADDLNKDEKWRIEEIRGVRVVRLKTTPYKGNGLSRGLNMLSNARRSLQIARILSDKPDVVFGDSVPPTAGWVAAHVAKHNKAKFIYQILDVWPDALVYNGSLSKLSPIYFLFRWIEKYLYRHADHICSALSFVHYHVKESGASPDKITWIPNGVDLMPYSDLPDYEGGNNHLLTAMYVGAFGAAHDVITIVRAARILEQKGIHQYRFIIIGDGIKRAECEREAEKYALTNIEFRDSISKLDVPKTQQSADILIAPVLDSKTYLFGLNLNKIYDYFASGRPVIFSGETPNDPVIESGAGFSIKPEDPQAMVKALEDYAALSKKERAMLGKKARDYAEKHFDVAMLTNNMEALLTKSIHRQ